MTPVTAHGRMDELGVLDGAYEPGTYALQVRVPDSVEAVQREWLDAIDAPLPDEYAEQLANAETCLYVGRSGNVYDRIMDHVRAQVRRASFVEAFGVDDIHGVYADDENSNTAEYNRAVALADATTCVWSDGELF